ncbi:hypothetical protein [Crenothrix polyspora]|uniref:Cytochrome c domain-containing protein n=1 Tax=Crenothrix polyspora TaxID=360316 RepID=A0A1R4HHW6_9GAMM|nr:hypothetical protein [Crenothrix polyspora]SJM95813.1 exported hypothetical protein [Crenothrix polyspora]
MNKKNALKAKMIKANQFKSLAFLTVTSLVISANVLATPSIMAQNNAPACSSCHGNSTPDKASGKAGLAAFLASKAPPPVVVKPPVVNPPVVVKPPVVNPPVVNPPVVNPPVVNPKPVVKPVVVKPKPITTGISCNSKGENDNEKGENDNEQRENHKEKSKQVAGLVMSAPGVKTIHVGQVLRVGVTASDDGSKISMGANLPAGAKFTESYNTTLQAEQGVVTWKVPKSVSGKTIKIKVCAQSHSNSGKKQDKRSISSDIIVKVLPQLKSVVIAQSTAEPVIASAVYNTAVQQLAVSGQITWATKSTQAERNAALANPVQLSNANNAAVLGSANVSANGSWSASIPVASNAMPSVIDAAFEGAVASKLVKRLP